MSQTAPSLPRVRSRIVSRTDAGGGLALVSIDATAVAGTYTTPGQYAWVEIGGAGGHFVLASRAGQPTWEIVVQPGGDAADALARAESGDVVTITAAMGTGYPCDAEKGRDVVVAMPASAIAAARAVLSRRLDDGDAARTTLLLGARTRADVPLAAELDAFRAAGATVVVCLSRESALGATGYEDGYVHDVALRTLSALHLTFFVAGATKAEGSLREALAEHGARVYSNY